MLAEVDDKTFCFLIFIGFPYHENCKPAVNIPTFKTTAYTVFHFDLPGLKDIQNF